MGEQDKIRPSKSQPVCVLRYKDSFKVKRNQIETAVKAGLCTWSITNCAQQTFLWPALNFLPISPIDMWKVKIMKTVLWVSRHEMTPPQYADLERVLSDKVRLLPWSDTVEDINVLCPALEKSDAAAVVLPPELISSLLQAAGEKPILQAISARIPTGRTITLPDGRKEPEFAFVHRCWKQVLRLEIEMRQL